MQNFQPYSNWCRAKKYRNGEDADPQKMAHKIAETPCAGRRRARKPEKLDVPKLREQIRAIAEHPKPSGKKIPISIRLDPDVVAFFRANVIGKLRSMRSCASD